MTNIEQGAGSDTATEVGHDVFVSYAREDQPFVRRLTDALLTHGKRAWVDWADIPPTAEWMAEIRTAIDSSDTYVAVISPDSLASTVCAQELEGAAEGSKRIVPIVYREVDAARVPESLAKLNWIVFDDEFDNGVASLVEALDTDLPHVKAHTGLLVKAKEWEAKAESNALLLRGHELGEAEGWLASAGTKSPPPTQLQTRFLLASRKGATRRQRGAIAAVVGALILSLVLSAAALVQRNRANEQERVARSREIAAISITQLQENQERALLLALEAEKVAPTAQADDALRRSLASAHLESLTSGGGFMQLRDASFDPTGRLVATVGDTLQIWDATSHELVMELARRPDKPLNGVAFSPDGTSIAGASVDHNIWIWDARTGDVTRILRGHRNVVDSVSFSSDGSRILSAGDDGTVRVWNARTGKQLHMFSFGLPILTADFDPTGRRILVVPSSGSAVIINSSMGETEVTLHIPGGAYLNDGRFSPDGQLIAVAGVLTRSSRGDAWIFAADTGLLKSILPHPDWAWSLSFSANGEFLATTDLSPAVRVWDVGSGTELFDLKNFVSGGANATAFDTAQFSTDGQRIVTAGGGGWGLWRTVPPLPAAELRTGQQTWGGDANPDARIVAAGNTAGIVVASADGKKLQSLDGGSNDLSLGPEGALLASATARRVDVWDTSNGDLVTSLHGPKQKVTAVDISPDGQTVAAGGHDHMVWIWDLETGKVEHTFKGFNDTVARIRFNPDGDLVAAGSYDGTVRIWDTATGEQRSVLHLHDGAWAVEFSPDGRKLYTGGLGKDRVKVWSVASGTIVDELPGGALGTYSIGVSPDGRFVATGDDSGTIHIVDARTGTEVTTVYTSGIVITNLLFLSDTEVFATTFSGRDQLLSCEVCAPVRDLIALAKSRVTRELTPEERAAYLGEGA